CSSCYRSFELTYGQVDFYRSKGYDLPKRCEDCRKNKHTSYTSSYNRPIPTSRSMPRSNSGSTTSSGSSSSGSRKISALCGCLTAAAVSQHFTKPEDCYELTKLRHYRD